MFWLLLAGLAFGQTLPEGKARMPRADRDAARATVTELVHAVEADIAAGMYAHAEPSARMAADSAIRAWGDDDDLTIAALLDLGVVLDVTGDYLTADEALRRAAAASFERTGQSKATADAYLAFGRHLRYIGDFDQARRIDEIAVAMARVQYGENDPKTVLAGIEQAALLGDLDIEKDQTAILSWCVQVQEMWNRTRTLETARCLADFGVYRATSSDRVIGRILVEQAYGYAEALLGPEHPDLGYYALQLGRARLAEGRYSEANALLERAVALQERGYGKRSPRLVPALIVRADTHLHLGRNALALTDTDRAVDIASGGVVKPGSEFQLGHTYELQTGNEDLPLAVLERGAALLALNQYDEAFSTFGSAAQIARSGSKEEILGYIGCADAKRMKGQYVEALTILEEAYKTANDKLGPDHPLTAYALGELGGAEADMGRMAEARAHFEAEVASTERYSGPNSIVLAYQLVRLSGITVDAGDAVAARAMAERALGIYMGYDPAHPELALVYTQLCDTSVRLGALDRARRECTEARERIVQGYGADTPAVLGVYVTRVRLFTALGDTQQAEVEAADALRVARRAFDETSPALAQYRVLAADTAAQNGHAEAAAAEVATAIGVMAPVLEADAPALSAAWALLGDLRMGSGDVEGAAEAYARARTGVLATEGAGSPAWVRFSVQSARADVLRGKGAEALAQLELLRPAAEAAGGTPLFELWGVTADAARATGDRSKASLAAKKGLEAAEAEIASLTGTVSDRERRALITSRRATLDRWLSVGGASPAEQWDVVLRWKGLAGRTEQLHRSASGVSENLRQVRAQIAELTYDLSARDRTQRLRALTSEKERLEREGAAVAVATASSAGGLPDATVSSQAICAALPADTALADVIRYRDEAEDRYVAYVVTAKGGACDVSVAALGAAPALDGAIARWRSLIEANVSTSRIDAQGGTVRRALWDPIAAATKAGHVWVVPDGAVATVPIAGLPVGPRQYVLTSRDVAYLEFASDVLRPTAKSAGGAMVVGGVAFGASASEGCIGALADLPGTAEEADAVEKSMATAGMKVTSLRGADATEGRVREGLSDVRIAHVATHGFFASDTCGGGGAGKRSASLALVDAAFVAGFDPMALSGLAFAGANVREDGHGDDGLLTAEEIASLDLGGTDLVVLSACETGLGEIAQGDGVLGLRRGLSLAGADGVVMSMWEVEDDVTMRLMELFYQNLLTGKGMPASEALRQAEISVMAEQLATTGEARPQAWAAFVAAGPGVVR